jgi:hypothetical protein
LQEIPFLCKMSFDGLPLDAWEPEALQQVVNSLDGELVEILPPTSRWSIQVNAWLKHPGNIPKLYDLEITSTAKRWLTRKHDVIMHVEEVLEASHGVIDYIPRHDLEEESRKRPRRLATWAGRVDGTGPPPYRDGAHSFGGATGSAQASGSNFASVRTEKLVELGELVELGVHKPV